MAETGARKWVYRFTWQGKVTEHRLGNGFVSFKDARARADDALKLVAQGIRMYMMDKKPSSLPPFLSLSIPKSTSVLGSSGEIRFAEIVLALAMKITSFTLFFQNNEGHRSIGANRRQRLSGHTTSSFDRPIYSAEKL